MTDHLEQYRDAAVELAEAWMLARDVRKRIGPHHEFTKDAYRKLRRAEERYEDARGRKIVAEANASDQQSAKEDS